jgi:hypothetical protein
LRERDKKKPDYKKFMKRPAPLVLSPPSADVNFRSRSNATGANSLDSNEEDVPWAEIIFESPPMPKRGLGPPGPAAIPENEVFWSNEAPPVALLALTLLGLVLLLYFSF